MTILGIDIGTSGSRAILVSGDGTVLGTGTGVHEPRVPHGGWSEQPVEDWWRSVVVAIEGACAAAGVATSSIDAVGLAGQMHGLVALDASMTPIRPAILWNDGRCEKQCLATEARLGIERLVELTGNRMLAGFTAPKLLWMREHEPDAFARIATVMLPKDWIRFRLTGGVATDVSDASGTAVFDCEHRRWSDDLLAELDLPRSWWPETAESCEVVGAVTAEAAAATGLREGVPVVAGAGDQASSGVGTGLVREGTVGTVLGTSGVLFAPTDAWLSTSDGRLHAFCHAVPGQWHLMGVMLSAAGSLDWFRHAITPDLTGDDAFQRIDALAAEVPVGADGVLFLPYLSGERTPHPDANARGTFVGLDLRHDRRHLARAVIEGVTHGMRECLDLVRSTGLVPREARLSGGGARSPLWRQLCADLLGVPAVRTTTTEGTVYGAAILAAVGAGLHPNVPAACDAWVRETDRLDPGPDAGVLDARHAVYTRLYPALREVFPAIATEMTS